LADLKGFLPPNLSLPGPVFLSMALVSSEALVFVERVAKVSVN